VEEKGVPFTLSSELLERCKKGIENPISNRIQCSLTHFKGRIYTNKVYWTEKYFSG